MSLLSNCGFLLAEGVKSERRKCFPPLMAPPPWEHFQPLSINTWLQWSKSRPAPPIYLLLCFNGNECVGGSNRGFFLSDQWTICSDHLLQREWCTFSEVFLVFLQNKRSVCSFFSVGLRDVSITFQNFHVSQEDFSVSFTPKTSSWWCRQGFCAQRRNVCTLSVHIRLHDGGWQYFASFTMPGFLALALATQDGLRFRLYFSHNSGNKFPSILSSGGKVCFSSLAEKCSSHPPFT